MTAASADEHPQFPLLFLRDDAFRSLAREGRRRNWTSLVRGRVEQLALQAERLTNGLSNELIGYGELAAEALEMLPSVHTRIYWTSRLPDPAQGEGVPKPGTELELPRFHRATTSQEAALSEFHDLVGGQGLPVMWSVDRATAPDVSPLSRTPELRTVVYPSRTRFRVESARLRHDAATGGSFLRVELSELPLVQPSESWNRPIVTRDIPSAGRRIGVSSFNARDWTRRGEASARVREAVSWTPVDAY